RNGEPRRARPSSRTARASFSSVTATRPKRLVRYATKHRGFYLGPEHGEGCRREDRNYARENSADALIDKSAPRMRNTGAVVTRGALTRVKSGAGNTARR